MRSDTRSTGSGRQPGGQQIDCCVLVPVMDRPTALTRPLPDVEGHRTRRRPAERTHLGTGEPTVDGDQFPPVPGRFVLQHGPQLAPGRITHRPGDPAVPQHVADGQVLDHERLVLTHESSRQLVQVIPAPVGDPGMDPRNPLTGLGPVIAALLLPRQGPLSTRQPLPLPAPVPRIGDLLPRRERDEGHQPHVDAHHGSGIRYRTGNVLTQQGHEPPPGTVPRHGDAGRLRVDGQRLGPDDVQGLRHLRQSQLSIAITERGARVPGRGLRPPLRLEARVFRLVLPEPCERCVQVAQRLLERDRRNLGQIGQLLGLLPTGEHHRRFPVPHPLLSGGPGVGTGGQGEVIDLPNAPERPRQDHRLRVGRVEAVLERPLHRTRSPHGRTLEVVTVRTQAQVTASRIGMRARAARSGNACPPPGSSRRLLRKETA
ncbi:hypothetical protein JOF58_005163 [Streptomyces cinnamonensis]|nr:hypothetical protein [Streptomyces virginiae]